MFKQKRSERSSTTEDRYDRIIQTSFTVLSLLVTLGPFIYNLATKDTMREQFVEEILPPLMMIICASVAGASLNGVAAAIVPRALAEKDIIKPLISDVSQTLLIFAMTMVYLEQSDNRFLSHLLAVFSFASNRGYDYYQKTQLRYASMYQAESSESHLNEDEKVVLSSSLGLE